MAAVPKSGIRKFFDVAATIPGAISLGVGEPDFVTPYHIRNAAINSILDGETQYTSNWGLLELRQEIAAYVDNRFHISYDPKNEILVTVGASEGIDLALRALLNPGEEVLVPEPSYVSYAPCVIFAGGSPVAVPTSEANNFVLTPEALEKAITPKTKALILPYPNNPTGGILGRSELEKLREVILRHDLIVISDEIYAELTYNGQGHVSIASLPGYEGADDLPQRLLQGLCHDRLAHGLSLRPSRFHGRDVQDSPVRHHVRAPSGTGGRAGGPAPGPGGRLPGRDRNAPEL